MFILWVALSIVRWFCVLVGICYVWLCVCVMLLRCAAGFGCSLLVILRCG